MLLFSLLADSLCDPGGARTLDPLIKSQLLYQLSHGVKKRNHFVDFRVQRYNYFLNWQ